MAVELIMGFRNDTFSSSSSSSKEENALREAASAGIQSVQNLINLLASSSPSSSSPHNDLFPRPDSKDSPSPQLSSVEIEAATDAAVSKFRKVISLLDRTRTGHARFRRAPVTAPAPAALPTAVTSLHSQQAPPPPPPTMSATSMAEPKLEQSRNETGSAFKVYCPTPIQRLPPLPHHHHHHHHGHTLQKYGSGDRKEPAAATTINFSGMTPVISSAANSFISSLTGETDSVQRSFSSGFQITNLSQVSSADKPPLSSYSLKRKCSSVDDVALKCGSSSGKCHCSKKR